MSQEKRFGKRVPLPSTRQIIRELKLLMRHNAESIKGAIAGARQDDELPVPANASSIPKYGEA